MLAQQLPYPETELPTRPLNLRPAPRFEPAPAPRTHLMLVREPSPTPRSLAWARQRCEQEVDSVSLQRMLRSERLNLG